MPTKKVKLDPAIFTPDTTAFLWLTFRPAEPCNLTGVKIAVDNNKKTDPKVEFKVLHGTKVLSKEQPAHKKAEVKTKMHPGIDLSIGIQLKAELEKEQTVSVSAILEIE